MRHQFFVGAAIAALIVPVAAYAQETTSTVRGTVTSGGTPVAGAEVTITHTPTGTVTTVATSENGSFSASGLQVGGPFTVAVVASGFTESSVTDIFTVIGQPFNLPIELASGAGDEIIVTASRVAGAGVVSQGPQTVLTAAQIQNVASFNRDVRDLSRRDPFATLDPTNNRAVSFAGQNPRFNRFSVDGVAISDSFGLNPDGLPSRRGPVPFDAIAQYQTRIATSDIREGNFQGGAINVVLKSGTNEFTGTGFYSYSSNKLTGNEVRGVPVNVPTFRNENFGAHLAGPIIPDRLFFAVTAERVRANPPILQGPADANAGQIIPNLTTAQITQVQTIARSVYNYDTGGVVTGEQDSDDRLVAKLDANISDTQRLSLTYTYTDDSIIRPQNNNTSTTTPRIGLASNAYTEANTLHVGVGQLNSEWTDNFTTELRAYYLDYKRGQEPLFGRGFGQFTVCTAPTSDRVATVAGATLSTVCPAGVPQISFGPDVSRQSNALNTQTYGFSFLPRLKAGDHDIKMLIEYSNKSVFNLFVQRTAGDYYFDSIADFQARTAQRLQYQNAIDLDPNTAAAVFDYNTFTFGIADDWRVTDTLNITAGFRYDLFGGDSRPVQNANFLARYNFTNALFLDGKGVFQPRFGFDWNPTSRLSVRGSAGVVAGGTPDVYVSNSFSNTGVLTSQVTLVQNNNGTFSGGTPEQGAAALTNVTGTSFAAATNAQLQGVAAASTAVTNALVPNFKIPRQFRSTLSVNYNADLGPLGDGWNFGANAIYGEVLQQVAFTDLRAVVAGGPARLTPDGRTRYVNAIPGFTGFNPATDPNFDIGLANTSAGRTIALSATIDKTWDFGLNIGGSYTYQDITDQAPATSSTANSNYGNGAFFDANIAAFGISNDQIRHQFKYYINFTPKLFGDYKTLIGFFGETRSGRPFSYTFQDVNANRSAVFGTTLNNARYLAYIPTGPSDPLVSYDSAATQASVDAFINSSGLSQYRGQVAPRNVFRSRSFTKIDLHLEQEFPAFITSRARFSVFADIENLGNLINSKWGVLEQFAFPFTQSFARVACLTTPVPTGTAPTATQAVTSTNQACAQYRYSNFITPAPQLEANRSLYQIRIGARFTF